MRPSRSISDFVDDDGFVGLFSSWSYTLLVTPYITTGLDAGRRDGAQYSAVPAQQEVLPRLWCCAVGLVRVLLNSCALLLRGESHSPWLVVLLSNAIGVVLEHSPAAGDSNL